MRSHDQELRRCRLEIERLLEENEILRHSSESFGALAERLNHRLKVSTGESPPLQTPMVPTRSGS
jgi:hypothetical protein